MRPRDPRYNAVPLVEAPALDATVAFVAMRSPISNPFARTYRAAGGDCQYELFADSVHEWVATPGPQTDRARDMVKAFIARQFRS